MLNTFSPKRTKGLWDLGDTFSVYRNELLRLQFQGELNFLLHFSTFATHGTLFGLCFQISIEVTCKKNIDEE